MLSEKIKSDATQEKRVLEELQKASGGWINYQYFFKTLGFTQAHRAIWNLVHKRERYNYFGQIEVFDFKDEFGFKSYRLVADSAPTYRPFSDKISTKLPKTADNLPREQKRLFKLSPIIF